jgi:hypothetical protein
MRPHLRSTLVALALLATLAIVAGAYEVAVGFPRRVDGRFSATA